MLRGPRSISAEQLPRRLPYTTLQKRHYASSHDHGRVTLGHEVGALLKGLKAQPDKQESCAVAGKSRDAVVNFDVGL